MDGKMIAEKRKEKGLTQLQLAEKLNVSNKTISRWETGEGYPDISILSALAHHLDITVDDLLADRAQSEVEVEVEVEVESEPQTQSEPEKKNSLIKKKAENKCAIRNVRFAGLRPTGRILSSILFCQNVCFIWHIF